MLPDFDCIHFIAGVSVWQRNENKGEKPYVSLIKKKSMSFSVCVIWLNQLNQALFYGQ